jgi:hypothetical protein
VTRSPRLPTGSEDDWQAIILFQPNEVWFSILGRKCLKRADFPDATIATQQIEGFMTTYNTHLAHPFEWKKGVRFYKRLKDKIAARSESQLAA